MEDQDEEYGYSDLSDYELSELDASDLSVGDENPTEGEEHVESDFKRYLVWWTVKFAIPRTAITELLKGVKAHVEIPFQIDLDLPCDYRSLLKTPRDLSGVITPAGAMGKFAYLGLKSGLNRLVGQGLDISNMDTLQISTFLDGFSPTNNRKSKFWALLHSVWKDDYHRVFMSGLYVGKVHKNNPTPFNEILRKYVDEFNELKTAPFTLEKVDHPLRLACGAPYIMDLPAKADAKCTKQSGYCSCDFCMQVGKWIVRSTYFPELTFEKRTNASFRSREQPLHHKEQSVLEEIEDLDMVEDFPLDPLHLVYLGANKRVLQIYLFGNYSQRLPKQLREQGFSLFEDLAESITKEFQWKPRDLEKGEIFKGKEHRYFLLYAGVVVFKNILPEKDFDNYLNLSVAIRILSIPELVGQETWLLQAEKMLYNFVYYIKHSVSDQHLVRVIHSLLHLVHNCRRFGALDQFSAFPFESYLGSLKRLLNGPSMPLEQIVKRYKEQEFGDIFSEPENLKQQHGRLGKSHQEGPVVAGPCEQFRSVILNEYFISTSKPDNILMLNNSEVLVVFNIIRVKNKLFFVGKTFLNIGDYFQKPMASSTLNIVVVKNLSNLKQFPVEITTSALFFLLFINCLW